MTSALSTGRNAPATINTPETTDSGQSLPAMAQPPRLTKRQKAAIIVRLLLREGADLSLADLPASMQMDLTHEMGALRTVDRATLHAVIEEFVGELQGVGMAVPDGIEEALDILDGALSPDCIRQMRQKAGVPVKGDPWAAIAELDADVLADLAGRESIEIAAVVLSKLPVSKAADILGLLPGDIARRITYAISTTGAVDPAVVRSIGLTIAGQLCTKSPPAFTDAPVARVGAILNSSSAATRDRVLEGLETADAGFARAVRREIFTFANIRSRIAPQDVPRIARAVDQGRLAQALAAAIASGGVEAEAAEFLLANMSQRLATGLRDEIEETPAQKAEDAEAAMGAVVEAIRGLQAAVELEYLPDDEG